MAPPLCSSLSASHLVSGVSQVYSSGAGAAVPAPASRLLSPVIQASLPSGGTALSSFSSTLDSFLPFPSSLPASQPSFSSVLFVSRPHSPVSDVGSSHDIPVDESSPVHPSAVKYFQRMLGFLYSLFPAARGPDPSPAPRAAFEALFADTSPTPVTTLFTWLERVRQALGDADKHFGLRRFSP